MKVIAQTYKDRFDHSKDRWLVEVEQGELSKISGHEYGTIEVNIGTEIKISDVFKIANKISRDKGEVIKAISNLRTFADLLESMAPAIMSAITNPKEDGSNDHS